jgi:hypothetical protein
MPKEDDIDGLAAEYVLGALDVSERRQVDARQLTDVSLTAAIVAWERRLAPLSVRGQDMMPPAHLFDGILTRISGEAAQMAGTADVVPLRRASSRRWALAAGASALAACLALAVVWFNDQPLQQVEGKMDCGKLYKDFWQKRDPQSYARISSEQLAGLSRMVLRAYDACQAGDEQDARALLARLREQRGGPPLKSLSLPG